MNASRCMVAQGFSPVFLRLAGRTKVLRHHRSGYETGSNLFVMQVSVHKAKTQLSKLLDLVEDGEDVVITWHAHPADTQGGCDLVRPETYAGRQRHGLGQVG